MASDGKGGNGSAASANDTSETLDGDAEEAEDERTILATNIIGVVAALDGTIKKSQSTTNRKHLTKTYPVSHCSTLPEGAAKATATKAATARNLENIVKVGSECKELVKESELAELMGILGAVLELFLY